MKIIIKLYLEIVITLFILFCQSASGQYAIPQSVCGSGGGSLSSADNIVIGTLGQPFIGITSNEPYRNSAGFWQVQGLITGIEEESQETGEYKLEQNYPNPFNSTTKIEYVLPVPGYVKLSIYNIIGSEIAILVNENVTDGKHIVAFDAVNLQAGVYFYRMQSGQFQETRRFVLLK
jgi:hypothetical protein